MLTVVGVALLMVSVDQTSVATALPSLQADLQADLSWASWTITIYSVGQILALPVTGGITQRRGPRLVFLVAIIGFTVASLLCAVTVNLEQLVVCRFVQGVAGGTLMPAATAIVAVAFGRDRDRGIALFTSIFPIGAIVGPIAGGVILSVYSWRGIFLINIPIGIVVIGAVLAFIGELPPLHPRPIDLIGVGQLMVTLLGAMAAITQIDALDGRAMGIVAVAVPALLAGGCGWAFFRRASKHPNPVVPVGLITARGLRSMNAINVLFGAAALGFSALIPNYAQVRFGIAPLAAGGLLTGRAVGMIATSTLSVALLRRTGFRPLLLVGFLGIAGGLLMTGLEPTGFGPELWLLLSSCVLGLGMGLAGPAANNAGMHLAPDHTASLTGLRILFRQVGSILSVSIATAVTSASLHPAATNSWVFFSMAILMVTATVLTFRLPNMRGRW
ncbi:MFS transporter [Pseudonocardia sp. GCM10023141]